MTVDVPPERPERWEIPPRVWAVLFSWGLAVLGLAGIFSYWTWTNEHNARREQDRAMCVMLELFTAGPEPVAGPAGDRGRAVLAAMRAYRATLRCS